MTKPSSFLLMVYKRALLLYPLRVRREYQQQMLQTLLDAHHEERAGSRRFWLKIYADLLHAAVYERIFMLREQVLKQPIFFHALCLGLILTFLGGTAAVTFQQMLRRGANQPQIEMAKYYATEIGSGQAPDDIIPPGYVDPERSLEPFVIFYDDQGRPEKATGYLDQSAPVPPLGVFIYSRGHGSDTFTWQPRPQVRIATVVQRVTGPHPGFLLAGRSLRNVEEDEAVLYRMTFLGWLVLVLLLASGAVLLGRIERMKPVSC
jgi:hypothetical protein